MPCLKKINKNAKCYSVEDIAKRLIIQYARHTEETEFLNNMKLQKLLYYEQGFHLAKFGTPLFEADIEAWMNGPVIPEIYKKYKKYGDGPIIPDIDEEVIILKNKREEKFFDDVLYTFGQYTPFALQEMTHLERPWRENGYGTGHIIPKETLEDYFDRRLYGGLD
jgi:uncharacterized phage-associated protein